MLMALEFAHGKLNVGEAMATPVIRMVKDAGKAQMALSSLTSLRALPARLWSQSRVVILHPGNRADPFRA